MALEDSFPVDIGIAETNRRQPRRLLVIERGGGHGDKVRLDRDEVVDEFGVRQRIIERHADDVVAFDARLHAGRRAGARQRFDEVAARRGVGVDHGSNNDHAVSTLRMTDAQVRRARVMAVGRNAVWVLHDDDPEPVLAALRKNDRRLVLAPGDLVMVRALDADRVVVDSREPRGCALVRTTAGGRTKTIATNIDTIAIVAALTDPPPNLVMIDQLIAFAVQHEVEAALILTKPTWSSPPNASSAGRIYCRLDACPDRRREVRRGIDELRTFLPDAPPSWSATGVGKSTIFRALGGTATVGELSRFGRGRQTTTSARLYRSEADSHRQPGDRGVHRPGPAGRAGRPVVEFRDLPDAAGSTIAGTWSNPAASSGGAAGTIDQPVRQLWAIAAGGRRPVLSLGSSTGLDEMV